MCCGIKGNKMDNLVVLFLLVFLKFLQEEVH